MTDMTDKMYERTEMVIGAEKIEKLNRAHVAVFGIGGVGGHLAEALVRAGIGELTIVDNDTVSESNLNRQIIALRSTIGRNKTDVMKEHLLDINPELKLHAYTMFYLPQNSAEFDFASFDYVCDCIDTVTAKIELVLRCRECGTPLISSMGTGNKLYPERLKVTELFETRNCPLAKIMRKELRKRGVDSLTVVASDELPVTARPDQGRLPGSMSFVPSAAGLIMAGYVVRELINRIS